MPIALRRYGVEVEFVRYPEGYHGLMRAGYPAHRADYLTRVVWWFREHLDSNADRPLADQSG